MRGHLDQQGLAEELSRVQRFLDASDASHWRAFAAAWAKGSGIASPPAAGT
jgi:hypothetical protein